MRKCLAQLELEVERELKLSWVECLRRACERAYGSEPGTKPSANLNDIHVVKYIKRLRNDVEPSVFTDLEELQ